MLSEANDSQMNFDISNELLRNVWDEISDITRNNYPNQIKCYDSKLPDEIILKLVSRGVPASIEHLFAVVRQNDFDAHLSMGYTYVLCYY